MSASSLVSSSQKMITLPFIGEVNMLYVLLISGAVVIGYVVWRMMQNSSSEVEQNMISEEEMNRMRQLQDLQLQTEMQQQQLQEMQINQEQEHSSKDTGNINPEANVSDNHGASLSEAFNNSSTYAQ